MLSLLRSEKASVFQYFEFQGNFPTCLIFKIVTGGGGGGDNVCISLRCMFLSYSGPKSRSLKKCQHVLSV